MTEKPTPEKIKQLFSSFLGDHDKDRGKNKDDKTQSETDTQMCSSAGNIKQFFERIETFTLTWFAKPQEFSPLACARYGWKNIDTDMLQCVNCRAMLCGTLPKQVDAFYYKESCMKLRASLIEAHETACKWTTNPTPEKLYSLPFHSLEELLQGFLSRLESLKSRKVPQVSYISTTEQGISKESLLNSILHIQGTTEVELSLMALCGWQNCDSHENVLQCSLCRRKIGLWNYGLTEETETEHTNSVDVPDETSKGVLNGKHGKHSDTNVISDNNCKGVQNGDHGKTSDNGSINEDLLTRDTSVVSAKRGYEGAIEVEDVEGVTVEPAKKRPKLEKKQCFDLVAEHRFWCPWIQCEVPEKGGHVAGSSPSPSVAIANAEHADTAGRPGWLRVVKILCHSDEGNELHVQLKKSPELHSLRHLRRVLHDCTTDRRNLGLTA